MIDCNNLIGLVYVLKFGEVVWFVFDQDYGFKGSVFVFFFFVLQVVIINGIYVLFCLLGVKMLSISMVCKLDCWGYSLYISEVMNDYLGEDKQIVVGYINKVIECEILCVFEQYLWVYCCFKICLLGEFFVY